MYKISKTTTLQSGSMSSSSGGGGDANMAGYHKSLPPLFLYMETGDWAKATERAKRYPREVKTWASIRSKSSVCAGENLMSGAKRLALHHACFKLRNTISLPSSSGNTYNLTDDPFIEVARFILLLLKLYPEAAGMRESRHGCLPLHLAAFASCTLPSKPTEESAIPELVSSSFSFSTMSSSLPYPSPRARISKPGSIADANRRCFSDATSDTIQTTMSAAIAEEFLTGTQTFYQKQNGESSHNRSNSVATIEATSEAVERATNPQPNSLSVSMGSNILISEKREEWAVKVLNALLDAFPRGIRMDSEGGRLPLHTACAGRATPRVVSTLITAYPAAARHRNKDGFLPLHLSAHWGISHPNVAISLLKSYPDATFGRNRWERTPLEEALCMAGENGRPHQAELVRSLRKHPSYWTRFADLFQATSPRGGNQIVDIDETLPSNEDESAEGDEELIFCGVHEGDADKGRNRFFRKGKKDGEGIEVLHPLEDLTTLIRIQDWDGVLARLETNPLEAEEELKVTTRGGFTSTSGFTPLHYAFERRPPQEVVDALITVNPNAVKKRTMPGGASPLHIACTWYAPVSSVNALLVVDRSACKIPDELGNLPIHSACFSGTVTPVVESVLRAYPKATVARNNQGSLPEEITKRLRHDNRRSVLALLNVCKGEVIAKKQQKHRRHRSDEYLSSSNRATTIINEDFPHGTEIIESRDSTGLEVVSGSSSQELMWV